MTDIAGGARIPVDSAEEGEFGVGSVLYQGDLCQKFAHCIPNRILTSVTMSVDLLAATSRLNLTFRASSWLSVVRPYSPNELSCLATYPRTFSLSDSSNCIYPVVLQHYEKLRYGSDQKSNYTGLPEGEGEARAATAKDRIRIHILNSKL